MKRLLTLFLFVAFGVNGQTSSNGRIMTGAAATRPTSCTSSDVWTDTDTPNSYKCFPNNTWNLLGNGPLTYTDVTFNATPTFSSLTNSAWHMTLTGNVTSSTFTTTGAAGTIFQFDFQEDGVGGRTFAFPGNVNLPTGFVFDTAASHHNQLAFIWNGTTWNPWQVIGSGGGGGSPGGVAGDLQCKSGASFAACNVNDTGTILNTKENAQYAGPNPYFDILNYGGYIQPTNTPNTASCSISATSTTLSCTSNPDFANGQGVVVPGAGQLPLTRNASFPAAPTGTVTPLGVSNGSTTYNYKYVLEDYFGGLTAAGTQFSTTTGAATLGTNTVSLTGVVRSGGIDTFTCSANCNIAVGSQIQISGFAALNVNGTVVTASNPSGTTFTVNAQGLPDYTETASATASVRACNALQPTGTLSAESVILRTWIYRGGTLVGVAPGQDPFYIDCNQGVTAPSYVPSAAPSSAQAGYLATTISSGGGTNTMTLAAAAGTTVSSVTVQHDNSAALIAAWTAAYAAHGGVVRIPIIPGNTLASFPFNALTNLNTISNPTAATVKLQVSVANLSQPWIMTGFSEFEGLPQTSTGFEYSPLGAITGSSTPLFLANANSGGGVVISKIKFAPTATGASSIVLDQSLSAGGSVGYQMNDNGYSGINASAVVIKGGFDFWFKQGICGVGGAENGAWFAHPCIELTNASPYINATTTQVPGRIKFYDMNFSGATAVQQDNFPVIGKPSNFTSGSLNLIANGILHENNAGPTFRIALGGSFGSGLDVSDILMSDQTNGTHQPAVEMTGSTNFGNVTLRNNKGGGNPLLAGGGTVATATCINNYNLFGCGQTSNYNMTGSISTVDGGQIGAINGGSIGYFMSTPAVPTSCVVSAGGTAPIGALTYTIVATDRNPVQFSPSFIGMTLPSPSCSATTTSGNQTVTITRPTLPSGATGWVVFRGGVEAFIAGVTGTCVTPIAASVTTYVDSVGSICGPSAPGINTAFSTGINSSGTNAIHATVGGFQFIPRTVTSAVTLGTGDGLIAGNTNSGSFAITLDVTKAGEYWVITNPSSGVNTLTIQPSAGTLDGGASTTIANNCSKTFTVDGTNAQTTAISCGGGGSGTITAAAQYSIPYYSASGVASTINGIAPQTTNGIWFPIRNVTGGVAVAQSEALLGVPINAQTCATYTLLYSDRASRILCSGTTTATITLPVIATNFGSNMPFQVYNGNSGNLTLTATTPNTIDGSGAGGSSTILPGWMAHVGSDNTPSWSTLKIPTFGAFTGSCQAITFNSSTGFPCASLFYQTVGNNGVSQTQRSRLNLIPGTNVTFTFADNSGTGSTDVTINSTVGGGGGTPCTTTSLSLQYNNGGAFGCVTEYTYVSSTITSSSAGKLDLSAASATAAFKMPSAAGAAPTTANIHSYDSTKNEPVFGNSITTLPVGVLGPADYNFVEDFSSNTSCTGNTGAFTVGVGSCGNVTAVAGHYGVISVGTTATINTITRFGMRNVGGNSDVFPALNGTLWVMKSVVRLAEPSCAVEACTINATYRLGVSNAWGAAPTDGWYFEAVEGATNTSNIQCVTRAASTSTSTDSGVALDTNWHTFTIFNDGSGSSAKFYIDGVLKCTNTTNIPSASPMQLDFQSTNTSANAKLTDFDYWSMYIATPRTN